jgi:hypothetical protein
MHASHEGDVLAPLAAGTIDSSIERTIEQEAAATALAFRE